jgi:hypothetical protein
MSMSLNLSENQNPEIFWDFENLNFLGSWDQWLGIFPWKQGRGYFPGAESLWVGERGNSIPGRLIALTNYLIMLEACFCTSKKYANLLKSGRHWVPSCSLSMDSMKHKILKAKHLDFLQKTMFNS